MFLLERCVLSLGLLKVLNTSLFILMGTNGIHLINSDDSFIDIRKLLQAGMIVVFLELGFIQDRH